MKMIYDFNIDRNSRFNVDKNFSIIEEKKILNILKLISPRRKMVDVGACEGYWSILLSNSFDSLCCYEPDYSNFMLLKKNTSKISKIKIYNFSLSDVNEDYDMIKFNYILNKGFNSDSIRYENFVEKIMIEKNISKNLSKKLIEYQNLKSIKVKSRIYDELDENDDKLDFINIDVNGDELKVLFGMMNTIIQKRPIIRINSNKKNIEQLMLNLDYIKTNIEGLWTYENREILI